MKVEINLNLDEFKNLLVNCDEFRQLLATGIEEPATETVESVGGVKGDEPSATKQEPESTVTMETVRAKLATLAQGGKQAEVKALIAKFGAKKLTDIAVAKYPELLAAAEGL